MADLTSTNPTGSDYIAALENYFFNKEFPWTYLWGGDGSFPNISPNTAISLSKKSVTFGPGIDCSHLFQQAMLLDGHDVPYFNSSVLSDFLQGRSTPATNEASLNYLGVPVADIQVGNGVVFDGHVGTVTYYDPVTGIGMYLGAQSSDTGLRENVLFTTKPLDQNKSYPDPRDLKNPDATIVANDVLWGNLDHKKPNGDSDPGHAFIGAIEPLLFTDPVDIANEAAAAKASLGVFQTEEDKWRVASGLDARYTQATTGVDLYPTVANMPDWSPSTPGLEYKKWVFPDGEIVIRYENGVQYSITKQGNQEWLVPNIETGETTLTRKYQNSGQVTIEVYGANGEELSASFYDGDGQTIGTPINAFACTITDPTGAGSTGAADPIQTPASTGIAASGGNWSVRADSFMLNNNTDLYSAIVSDALTGGIRPGNWIVSGTSDSLNNILNSANIIDTIIASAIGTPVENNYFNFDNSVINLANSGSNIAYIPADPLILDLNGDGVKLRNL